MDTTMLGLFIFLVVFQVSNSQNGQDVELTIHPPGIIKQGDTVTLTCTIKGAKIIDINRISRVVTGQRYTIATNNALEKMFQDTGRYSTAESDNPVQRAEVVIENVEAADSGEIVCSKGGGQNMEAVETIHVKVPPSKVELQLESTAVADGDTIPVMEGHDEPDYACVVEVDGDNLSPIIGVTLGAKAIGESMEKEEVPVISGQNGFSDNKFSATYRKSSDSPNLASKKYHGKTLTCTAHTEPFAPVSTSFTIEYYYGPKVDKCQTTQLYQVGGSMVLSCKSSMYPPPSSVTWSWGANQISSGETSGDGRYTAEVDLTNEDKGEYLYSLTLDTVLESDDLSNHIFTLSIENAADKATVDIKVEPTSVPVETETTTPTPVVTDGMTGEQKTSDHGSSASPVSASLFFTLVMFVFMLA